MKGNLRPSSYLHRILDATLDDHLGYEKNDPAGRNGGNSRNGHRAKTVLTDTGPVDITVPRDRDSSFEPRIVAKRQRRLTGIDDMVISLSIKNRGVRDVCMVVCDGLKGLPDAVGAVWEKTIVQTCAARLLD